MNIVFYEAYKTYIIIYYKCNNAVVLPMLALWSIA